MATFRVGYKRTFQVKPYESQVIELSIEAESPGELQTAATQGLKIQQRVYQQLESLGDAAMAEALGRVGGAAKG
jgi:hypothetical protein